MIIAHKEDTHLADRITKKTMAWTNYLAKYKLKSKIDNSTTAQFYFRFLGLT